MYIYRGQIHFVTRWINIHICLNCVARFICNEINLTVEWILNFSVGRHVVVDIHNDEICFPSKCDCFHLYYGNMKFEAVVAAAATATQNNLNAHCWRNSWHSTQLHYEELCSLQGGFFLFWKSLQWNFSTRTTQPFTTGDLWLNALFSFVFLIFDVDFWFVWPKITNIDNRWKKIDASSIRLNEHFVVVCIHLHSFLFMLNSKPLVEKQYTKKCTRQR